MHVYSYRTSQALLCWGSTMYLERVLKGAKGDFNNAEMSDQVVWRILCISYCC